jgi:hypothetical protein
MSTLNMKNNFECEICKKSFTFKYNLNKHIKTFHPQSLPKSGNFKCNICQKDYATRQYLKKHMEKIHPEPKNPKDEFKNEEEFLKWKEGKEELAKVTFIRK